MSGPRMIQGPILYIKGNATIHGWDERGKKFGPVTVTEAMELRLHLTATEYGYMSVFAKLLANLEEENIKLKGEINAKQNYIQEMHARSQYLLDFCRDQGWLGDEFYFEDNHVWRASPKPDPEPAKGPEMMTWSSKEPDTPCTHPDGHSKSIVYVNESLIPSSVFCDHCSAAYAVTVQAVMDDTVPPGEDKMF